MEKVVVLTALTLLAHGRTMEITDQSVQCDPRAMHAHFAFSRPFRGTVYARDFGRNERCRTSGTGQRRLTLSLHVNTDPLNEPYCGVRVDQRENKFVAEIIVSYERLELADFLRDRSGDTLVLSPNERIFLVECHYHLKDVTIRLPSLRGIKISQSLDGPQSKRAYGRERHRQRAPPTIIKGAGAGILPVLDMAIREGWGVTGRRATSADVGQRITLDVFLTDNLPYDFFMFNCVAHDGSRSDEGTVTLVDADGCARPIDRVVEGSLKRTVDSRRMVHKHVPLRGFQFSTSDVINFECQLRPCLNRCNRTQCDRSALRHGRSVVQASTSPPAATGPAAEDVIKLRASVLVSKAVDRTLDAFDSFDRFAHRHKDTTTGYGQLWNGEGDDGKQFQWANPPWLGAQSARSSKLHYAPSVSSHGRQLHYVKAHVDQTHLYSGPLVGLLSALAVICAACALLAVSICRLRLKLGEGGDRDGADTVSDVKY